MILPEGCVSIESGAFADMDLWEIYIPDSVTDIDEDAFRGSGGVFIVADTDSTAAKFAEDNGIPTWPDVF